MKEYIGSQEHFEDEVNAYYDKKEQFEKSQSQGQEEYCNCAIPYFPTGDIKNCSRCGKPTVY